MIKRQRGRGRNPGQKPQNNNPNRSYESNGPDLKVRGSAQTVFEKYQQLGRDAQSNGDRVLGENYMQHAEHYFRVIRAMQPSFVPRSEMAVAGFSDDPDDGDDVNGDMGEEGGSANFSQNGQPEFQQNRGPRENRNRDRDGRDRDGRDRDGRDRDGRDRDGRERPPQRDFQQNREPRDPNEPRNESDEDRFGRRRRRPNRYGNDQPDNGSNEAQGEGEYRSDEPAPSRAPASFEGSDFVEQPGFSNPQEIVTVPEGQSAAPARERRPRPARAPRAPRAPRESAPSAEQGFGEDMPAFLATSVPASTGD